MVPGEMEMKEYLDLVDNLHAALKKGQMEMFLQSYPISSP